MSPTLSSITQGVPLDTSKLPADQRLPPYPYNQPGLLLPAQGGHKALPQPVRPPPAPPLLPSAAPQRPFSPQYQPNASLQPLGQPLGDFALGTFDQFGMGEGPGGTSTGFPEDLGYQQSEGGYEPHILNRPPHSNCSRHGGAVPNIILTGDSPPGISKEIASALAGVPGFEVEAAALGLEEELRMEPLSLDGLHMLSDPCALLPDPAVEEAFRSDRLQ